MAESTHRKKAEEEAHLDLEKSHRQLLVDIHDELLRDDRTPELNFVHAQKRIASLYVRVAESVDRQSQRIYWLTWVLVGLAIATLVMA